jgi:hypothetical protein
MNDRAASSRHQNSHFQRAPVAGNYVLIHIHNHPPPRACLLLKNDKKSDICRIHCHLGADSRFL